MIKKYFFIMSLLLLSSCFTLKRGKIIDTNDANKIDINFSNKNDVVKLLGFPSFVSKFNSNRWVYYSYKLRRFLFIKPYFIEQKILLIEFNKETELVKNMTLYDINSNKYEMTEKSDFASDNNIIKDIFSNIGQIKM
ncbi:MAG: outer membrane protein assembly factor BamE [Rickettsiales bacterium]|nr:outer membrane protein assembly factor BamE [Rickettsiales bacterium]